MNEIRPLPENLRSLGIEELKERLELSTLAPVVGEFHTAQIDDCCCCKIGPDNPDNPPPPGDDRG